MQLDNIVCICMDDRPAKKQNLEKKLKKYIPGSEPIFISAVNTRHLGNHHIGCALSHRKVIKMAKDNNWSNVLVFEEDATFRNNFTELYYKNLLDLDKVEWEIYYLGACVWDPSPSSGKPPRVFPKPAGVDTLGVATMSTCTHGLVYNSNIYDRILSEFPDNATDMEKFLKKPGGLDQWFMYKYQPDRKCYISVPRICSQPFLIGKNKQDKPEDFDY